MRSLLLGERRIGLGTAPIGIEGRPSPEVAAEVIRSALEAGIRIIDTADAYCLDSGREHGYTERIVGDVLAASGRPAELTIATKVGEWRPGDGSWRLRGDPDSLRLACEASLIALGVSTISLLQLHRPDPAVPIEESVGALEDLRVQGKAEAIGVCNVTPMELERAMETARITTVQNRFHIGGTSQQQTLELCDRKGVVFIAHSPFGGPHHSSRIPEHSGLRRVAQRRSTTAHVVALAWLLAQSQAIVAIPGTKRPDRIASNLAANDIVLDDEDLALLGNG